ncbi:MAG: SDR family NAD(P)-dependent oxidoreductase [Chitinophagales bacterium]|jgi:short-subunit dehydrogenase|nr:SDR family NAD(P)-dependent oxidoreductase [Chitinophagales bacterium]
MENKTILITGASSGVGYQSALQLAEKGHTVIALARNAELLNQLSSASNGTILSFSHDLSSLNFDAILSFLKEKSIDKIDVLINNAGQLVNNNFEKITSSELIGAYNTNVFAPYLLIQALFPLLKNSKNPHIINISSVGGIQGSVKFAGLSAYSSSKGALTILTECLAEEFKEINIKVNCLALGAVNTEMLAKAFPGYKAPLSAAEMGNYITWFAENGHQYFNGKIIPVALSTP